MTITYEWNFSQFDTKKSYDGLTDVVSVVHWRLFGTDENGTTTSNYGTVTLSDPLPESFVPYDQITKEIVIQWMEELMDVPKLQENLSSQIYLLNNPPTIPTKPPFD
jgi:hypothetical protein